MMEVRAVTLERYREINAALGLPVVDGAPSHSGGTFRASRMPWGETIALERMVEPQPGVWICGARYVWRVAEAWDRARGRWDGDWSYVCEHMIEAD